MNQVVLGDDPVDTVVCDIDGVVVLGGSEVPGAGEALQLLSEAGLRLVFATNNAARTVATIRNRLIDMTGFDPGVDSIVTSAMAAARHVAATVDKAFVLGTDALVETLCDDGVATTDDWSEADAVVIGLNPRVTYESLAHAGLAIQNGATFYATNSDVAYPRPDGLYPGAGALVAAVAATTGVEPIFCGKPFSPMREVLKGRGGAHPLIIGDRPDTDIALGKAEGWPTVLVLSGVVSDPAAVAGEFTPDLVINSLADLPKTLGLSAQD